MLNDFPISRLRLLCVPPILVFLFSGAVFIARVVPAWKIALAALLAALAVNGAILLFIAPGALLTRRRGAASLSGAGKPLITAGSAVLLSLTWITVVIGIGTWFFLPGETTGLSFARLLLISWLLVQGAAVSLAVSACGRGSSAGRFIRESAGRPLLLWGALVSLIGSLFFLITIPGLGEENLRVLFVRLLPCAAWLVLLNAAVLIMVIKGNARSIRSLAARVARRAFLELSRNWQSLLVFVLLLAAATALFLSVTDAAGRVPESDYYNHANATYRMEVFKRPVFPHFLYSLLILGLRALMPGSPTFDLGVFVVVFFHIYDTVVIYALLSWQAKSLFPQRALLGTSLAAASALFLSLAAPVTLFTWQDHHLYYGYISQQVYHNPTFVVLKPLALLLFLVAMKTLMPSSGAAGIPVLPAFLLTMMNTLAKPNFIICILPASGLALLDRLRRKEAIDWVGLVGGIYLPALLVLAWQFGAAYSETSLFPDKSSIIFSLFGVLGAQSDGLLVKFILSILFPGAVYLFFWRDVRRDFGVNFSWLVFAWGALYTYMFAESGVRYIHGNFLWSGMVTLHILFVVSFMVYTAHLQEKRTRPALAISGAFLLLHVLSGVVWLSIQFQQNPELWY